MFTTITTAMIAAVAEKDGTSLPAITDVMAHAALDALKQPSQQMLFAGAAAIHAVTGVVVSYEQAGAVFVAMVNEAKS